MTDSPNCPVCEQPIRLDDFVCVWSGRQTMEHIDCHVLRRRSDTSAEAEASADPAYGPMS